MFNVKTALLSALIAATLAACGQAPLADTPTALATAALPPGSLDPTFNDNFQGFSISGFATHIATLPNGKAIVVFELQDGSLGSSDSEQFIVVRRYNEDGTHDRTFGGPGKTAAVLKFLIPSSVIPRDLVVTPEGRIFIAASGFTSQGRGRPIIYALTPSGTPDNIFDGASIHLPSTPIANSSVGSVLAEDLAYDPATEKLTLGGTVRPKSGNDFLWTYTVEVNNTSFPKETVVKKADADLEFAKFQRLPGGEMVIAGGITPASGGGIPRSYLVRQLDNGLITREAVNGVGFETFVTGLRVDGSKVFLTGAAFTGSGFSTQGFVARFDLETLTKDASFGSSGLRFVSQDVRDLTFSKGSGTNKKVLVAGTDGTDYMAARMSYNGQMDNVFGNKGVVLVDESNIFDARALSLSVDSKNRVWLAGLVEGADGRNRGGLARLLP